MQLDTPAAALPVIVIARGKEISILSGEAIKTVSHNYSLWHRGYQITHFSPDQKIDLRIFIKASNKAHILDNALSYRKAILTKLISSKRDFHLHKT